MPTLKEFQDIGSLSVGEPDGPVQANLIEMPGPADSETEDAAEVIEADISEAETEAPSRHRQTKGTPTIHRNRAALRTEKTVPEERLQKILSGAGITSRRKAEQLILEGRVAVNGKDHHH